MKTFISCLVFAALSTVVYAQHGGGGGPYVHIEWYSDPDLTTEWVSPPDHVDANTIFFIKAKTQDTDTELVQDVNTEEYIYEDRPNEYHALETVSNTVGTNPTWTQYAHSAETGEITWEGGITAIDVPAGQSQIKELSVRGYDTIVGTNRTDAPVAITKQIAVDGPEE